MNPRSIFGSNDDLHFLVENLEVRRLLASLQPDATFGVAGVANSPFPNGGVAVAELADRKVLIVGSTSASTPNLSVARLDASGVLDSTFGTNGISTAFPVTSLGDALIQSDGTVIASGRSANGFFVAKLKPDGKPDPSFSGDGIAPLDDKIPGDATPVDLDMNESGRIVVGGSTTGGGSFIFKLKADGSADKTFSGDGMFFETSGGFGAVASLDDEKVLACDGSHHLIRFTASGGVDSTFGTNGSVYIKNARAIEVQADGKILLLHADGSGSFPWMEFSRYAPDGTSAESLDGWENRRSSAAIAISPISGVISLALDWATDYNAELFRYGASPSPESINLGSTSRGLHIAPTSVDGVLLIGENGGGGFVERFGAPPGPVTLTDGVLVIRGTTTGDTIGVTIKAGQLRVRLNGVLSTFIPSSVKRIEVASGAGNDWVDFSGISIPTYVDAGAGNDLVTAGSGNDSITGGAGKDILDGGEGDDRINGNGTQDKIWGRGGSDRIYGGDHNDYIDGGGGVDRIWGDAGNDTILGASSGDKLDGGTGDDSIRGGIGNDVLSCGGGLDSLFGNDGDDTFAAKDAARDIIDGGPGTDSASADQVSDTLLNIESEVK